MNNKPQLKTNRQQYNLTMSSLNSEQAKAVTQIEGPVMVIAGPGTGKTQILAVRVAHILSETDSAPYNILCLTYTDAATMSMRRRLAEIIGPTAHQIHIYTFHGFCNQIIQDNLSDFGDYRQLDLISDLERVDVYKTIIESLPDDHILKNLKAGPEFESGRLRHLFDLMKKENYTYQDVELKVTDYLEKMKDPDLNPDPSFFYTRPPKGFNKGDLNPRLWNELEEKMNKLLKGAELFIEYQKILDKLGRYDYMDMILWVVNKFKEDDIFLARYQEQYQYLLVDEFQDTNGAQKDLLELLVAYWEEAPNIFVVGDDDQAIFKFQGANLSNIIDLKKEYNPYMVVLKDNYRSSQHILDLSKQLIEINTERIINEDDSLNKNLIAAGKELVNCTIIPEIREFKNISQELAYTASEIYKAYEQGVNLDEIAVICRNHSQIAPLAEVLVKKKVPINLRRRIDILKTPLIKNLLNILYFINEEYESLNKGEHRLFEIMHYHFFDINSQDAAKISMYCRGNDDDSDQPRHIKDIIGNNEVLEKLNLKSVDAIHSLNDLLDQWIMDISNVTLQVLFQKILNDGKVLKYVMNQPDKVWLLEVLTTFFESIKSETSKDPDMQLSEFLGMIDKMKENKLQLPVMKVNYSDNGVHLLTAHASKGLEFNTVYILGATANKWEKPKGGKKQYTFPDTMNADSRTTFEDDRRLFYVAMTRAKKYLYINYASKNDDSKDLSPSCFIDEISESPCATQNCVNVDSNILSDFQVHKLMPHLRKNELLEHDRINEILENYSLSVTDLNKYLSCPMSFYFEKILRVPTARTKYLGFGNAVHLALDLHFRDISKTQIKDKQNLLDHYHNAMNRYGSHFTQEEFKSLTALGKQILTRYFDENISMGNNAKSFEPEINIHNTEYKGIPIKGKLDRVDVFKDYVEVIDYKTGKPENASAKFNKPNDKDPKGGDYWRQIVFYKLLLDSDKKHDWNMHSGFMAFVEPDKKDNLITKKITVSPDDLDVVGSQIKDTWTKIQNHEFLDGCQDDKCYWCNFVNNEYVGIGEPEPEEHEI